MIKVLFFSAKTCKYCPAMETIAQQYANKYDYPIEIFKREDNIEPFIDYNVTGLPTIMLLHKEKPVWSATGTIDRSKIDQEFSKWSF